MENIERNTYLQKIINYMWDGQVKVITGIRRCGKSVLLFELFFDYLLKNGVSEKNIIRLELDKRKDIRFRNPIVLLNYVYGKIENSNEKYYLFIDEVQFSYIVEDPDNNGYKVNIYDMLNELKDVKNLDVYVTGSNSSMLSKDISTQFRGRASQIHVYPFTFKELYENQNIDKKEAFREYMLYGGMPYIRHLKDDELKREYLQNLFSEVYIKDIVERYHIKREDVLEQLLDYLSSSISSLTNPTNIANTMNSMHKNKKENKVDNQLIREYINYLKDAFLIQEAKRYDVKGKSYFNYPNKYYYCDIGLRNVRLNYRQMDQGHMMENIIYNDLIARGYMVDVGMVIEKTASTTKQKEVDFIVNKGNQRVYIQSAYEMMDANKIEAETKSLRLLKDEFKKIIVQNDVLIPYYDEYGIYHISVIDFLLEENLF